MEIKPIEREIYWDKRLVRNFEEILLKDEEVLWAARPVKTPFLLTDIWPMLLALLIGIGSLVFVQQIETKKKSDFFYWIFPVFVIVQPLWFAARKLLTFPKTMYAYTNKRVLIRTGIFGVKFISLDYNKIFDMQVNQSLIEKRYEAGTIKFYSGKMDSEDNTKVFDAWTSIEKPHEVFKRMKEIAGEFKPEEKPKTKIVYRTRPRRGGIKK
jgi:hypothetical protein